jgi:hypothetical protein
MVKQFRSRPLSLRKMDAVPEVWLDGGNLVDWLGDAISRVECMATREPGSVKSHTNGKTRFKAYLDGELIGEIRDDAKGRTYTPLRNSTRGSHLFEELPTILIRELPSLAFEFYPARAGARSVDRILPLTHDPLEAQELATS